ncbi:phage minor capsid protein, partial [Anaerococcus porci]|uniref:phage minor capsid protein n=1 Tax=Anaerococcus porci TaxID=2652269 RepID=UPI002A763B4D
AKDMGQDLMEISAHAGARPSHAVWQGQVVSISGENSKYLSLDDIGYGEVTGFMGANCRHNWYPYFEGISERVWSKEELDNIEPEPFEFEGKEYTYYEATQKQRQIERAIRKYKHRVMMYERLGDDESRLIAQVRLQRQRQLYKDFNKAGNLRAKPYNLAKYGYNKSKASKEVWATKKAQKKANSIYNLGSDKKNLDIYLKDEKLRKEIKNTYNLNIHKGRQDKHVFGTNNYINDLNNGKYNSYLLDKVNPQELVDKYSGKGIFERTRKGNWKNKELVTCDEFIGVNIDNISDDFKYTNKFYIHYSKEGGVHIVPTLKGDKQ